MLNKYLFCIFVALNKRLILSQKIYIYSMKNNTKSITDFSQLVENLNESGIKNNVAVVWAEDSHTLDAVEMAHKAGVINPILVCSQETAEKFNGKYETLLANDPQDA